MAKTKDWKEKSAAVDVEEETAQEAPSDERKRNLCPVCEMTGEQHELRVELQNWICPRCSYQEPRQANAGA